MPRFVVHRHDATNLHFDLRLEVAGALASWAVPKGPSVDPRDKRLAVRVEDHELSYVDYEGRFEHNGRVHTTIVWDIGTFENATVRDGAPFPADQALERGHLKFVLTGHKLTGGFALTRTRMGGDARNWILVKIDDEGADRRRNPTSTQNESVLSGRTNEDLR